MSNDNGSKPPATPPAGTPPPGMVAVNADTKWVMIVMNPVEDEPCAVALNEPSGITFQEAALLVAQALPIIIHSALETKPKEKPRIHIPRFGRG